jgi:thiamine-phosphate diphosphorylase
MTEPASLPELYLITPSPVLAGDGAAAFLAQLEEALRAGIRLVQLRAPGLDRAAYARLFAQVHARCRQYDARLLANTTPEEAQILGAQGVHLNSARLMACQVRPLDARHWVSAACHDMSQLRRAGQIGIDFVTLSPVLPTRTHPEAQPLGWQAFAELVAQATVPVFALGGMDRTDLARVKQAGGHGIAAISGLWGA